MRIENQTRLKCRFCAKYRRVLQIEIQVNVFSLNEFIYICNSRNQTRTTMLIKMRKPPEMRCHICGEIFDVSGYGRHAKAHSDAQKDTSLIAAYLFALRYKRRDVLQVAEPVPEVDIWGVYALHKSENISVALSIVQRTRIPCKLTVCAAPAVFSGTAYVLFDEMQGAVRLLDVPGLLPECDRDYLSCFSAKTTTERRKKTEKVMQHIAMGLVDIIVK
jgi:hypothetical protein